MSLPQRIVLLGCLLILANGCSKKENQIAVEPKPDPVPVQPPDSSGLDLAKKSPFPFTSIGLFAAGEFPEGVKLLSWNTESDSDEPVLEFGKLGQLVLSQLKTKTDLNTLVPAGATVTGKNNESIIYQEPNSENFGLLQTISLGSQQYLARSTTRFTKRDDAQKVSEWLSTIKPTPELNKQEEKQRELCKELESKGVRADLTGLGVKLTIEGKGPTDEVASQLASIVGIRELILDNTESLTSKGYEALGQLRQVVRLTLKGRVVSDAHVSYFSKYPFVHTLVIEDHRLSDNGLNAFENYTHLRNVSIASGRSADYVGPSKLTGLGLNAFRYAKKLARLELDGEHVSSLGFSSIGELKNLRELVIVNSPRAGQGILALTNFANLTRLTLKNLALTDLHLKGMQLPALVSLHTSHTRLENPFPNWKTAFPACKHLQLDQSLINDSALKLIAELPLETLSLKGTAITDAGLDALAKMTELRELYLDATNIVGSQLEGLKGLTQLTHLGLSSTRIRSENIAKLSEFKNLQTLDLQATPITDADIKPLGQLEKLQALDVSGTRIKGSGLVALSGLKELKSIRLEEASGTYAGITEARKVLGEKLKAPEYPAPVAVAAIHPPTPIDKLPEVSLDALNKDGKKATFKHENNDRLKPIIEARLSGEITDTDLGHLRNLKELQLLEISNAPKLSDAGLTYLAGLGELVHFTLKGTGVKGAGLGVLAQFKKLRTLQLEGIPLDATHLEILSQIPTLERVRILCPVEDYLELMTKLPNIKAIYLSAGTLNDRRVEMLAGCKNLEELFLTGSPTLPITDRSAKVLEQFKNLNALTIDSTQITDLGMESIARCENLFQLTLGKNLNIKNPLAKLTPLKKLERLRLPGVSLGTDYSGLSGLENLHTLDLANTDATDTLANLLGNLKELEELNVSASNVSDLIVERLKNCPEIRILNLNGTKVTGRGFQVFKDQEELRLAIVKLRESAVTDEGLAGLNKATSIEVLDLSHTNISDTGIQNIYDLKRLKQLDLEGCKKITDKSVNTLKLFKNLTSLNLEGTSLTADGVAQLRKLLPDCEIKGK